MDQCTGKRRIDAEATDAIPAKRQKTAEEDDQQTEEPAAKRRIDAEATDVIPAAKRQKQEEEQAEPILTPAENPFVFQRIQRQQLWDFYIKARDSFWVETEIDFSKDATEFKTLNQGEQHFILRVLAFFASSDFIVNFNLTHDFSERVCFMESQMFFRLQAAMEDIHSLTYSLQIHTLVPDGPQKDLLFEAMDQIESIRAKGQWALQWIHNGTFIERLVAFSIVEGVFFSASFGAIFWIKQRGIMPGLCFSNELISRDEGLHRDHAACLYRDFIVGKLPKEKVIEMMTAAVAIEKAFVADALPLHIMGMNSDRMCVYVEWVADNLLEELGLHKHYNVPKCPLEFMDKISMPRKTNFFEGKVSEYSKSSMGPVTRFDYDPEAVF